MELEILRKKLSTYKGEGGRLMKVSDELAMEVLQAWEQWTGAGKGFYAGIGVSAKGMASIIGKAKKLKREGRMVSSSEFTEVTPELLGVSGTAGGGIELSLNGAGVIRFPKVDDLIEFLKKAA